MAENPAQDAAPQAEVRAATIRRAPKYSAFALTGAALGAVAAFLLTVLFPETEKFAPSQVFGYLLLITVTIGLGLGCLAAWLIDRTIGRRQREVSVRVEAAAPAAEHSETIAVDGSASAVTSEPFVTEQPDPPAER